jgi:hypothetical protein
MHQQNEKHLRVQLTGHQFLKNSESTFS